MKNSYKALVVDDERLARKELKSMLKKFDNINIIGEASDVKSAIGFTEKFNPDVIFLDIQMPGETGFDFIEKVNTTAKIIFVTAYDEYAINAFEINALDYLLKPVNATRLQNAIERLEESVEYKRFPEKNLQYDDVLFLMVNSQMKFLKITSIICILASGDYTSIITCEGVKGLVSRSMKEWEEKLPENHFSRIHRSTIINVNYILKTEEWFNNSYRVYMKNIDTPFSMSRRYVHKLKRKF